VVTGAGVGLVGWLAGTWAGELADLDAEQAIEIATKMMKHCPTRGDALVMRDFIVLRKSLGSKTLGYRSYRTNTTYCSESLTDEKSAGTIYPIAPADFHGITSLIPLYFQQTR